MRNVHIPKRPTDQVAKARPLEGNDAELLKRIREKGMERYGEAYKELAKR